MLKACTIENEVPYYAQVSISDNIAKSSIIQPEISNTVGYVSQPKANKTTKRVGRGGVHKEGVFSPIIVLAKKVLEQYKLNKLRGKAITTHSDVISSFIDTHKTHFGQTTLSGLYCVADTDGDSKLSTDKMRSVLHALGFIWLKEKQIDGIMKRVDLD